MSLFVDRLETSAGFLQDSPVDFAPGLTCLIGARGTCKSTIIETLRFVLDCDPDRISVLLDPSEPGEASSSLVGLVRATLEGGTATCHLRLGGTQLRIERDADDEPRVYRDGVKDFQSEGALGRIEIYSQGDLQRIASDPASRLALIDQPNREQLSTFNAERRELTEKIKRLGAPLREARSAREARKEELGKQSELHDELSRLQGARPQLDEALEREREAYLSRQATLKEVEAALTQRQELIERTKALLSNQPSYSSLVQQLDELGLPAATEVVRALREADDFISQTTRELDRVAETVPDLSELKRSIDELDEEYHKIRQQQEEVVASLKAEDRLKQQIEQLNRVAEQEAELAAREDSLLSEREELRKRLRQISDEIYALRLGQVEAINSAHRDHVLLTLHQGTQTDDYEATINKLMSGSRLRKQEEIASSLAKNVLPHDLVDIVEAGDTSRLAQVAGRSPAHAAKLLSFLHDSDSLWDLEGAHFEDLLEITMYVDQEPKPVHQLSKGQMATALLPLVLREASHPLVIDQPEDDLDNRYIFENLVERIRDLKHNRQLIFVTHNANIPVLGEADRVVVMRMSDPKRALAPTVGTVDEAKDEILQLLEGGAQAFKRRQAQYGSLIS